MRTGRIRTPWAARKEGAAATVGSVTGWARLRELSPRGALGTAADLITVLTVVGSAVTLGIGGSVPQAVLAGVVSALALAFLAIAFNLQRRLAASEASVSRSEQVGRSLPQLAEAIENLGRAAALAASSRDAFLAHTTSACRAFGAMLGVATGTPCRVTVVEVYSPQEPPEPSSDSRALAVRRVCCSYPESGSTRDQIDWVHDNTDFAELFEPGGKDYFFCNDLPAEIAEGYKNSHWDRAKIAEMRRTDSFPYRSTVVWPVQGWVAEDGTWDLIGFLSVDSRDVEVFDEKLDVPTGATFAHALYLGMATYRDLRDLDEDVVTVVDTR